MGVVAVWVADLYINKITFDKERVPGNFSVIMLLSLVQCNMYTLYRLYSMECSC
jgi:hypothetical protein